MSDNDGKPQSFDDAITAIDGALTARDAVTIEREALAPTRALATQYLEEFQATVARLRPTFDNAVDRYNRALRVGVVSPDLRHTLTEALTVIRDGPNSFHEIINTIDNLNDYAVYQGWHRSIPGRLRQYRAGIGALDTLAARARYQLGELEKRVLVQAKHVPEAGAKYVPERRETTVDHAFDPRSA
jgi:hypothetical protein